MATLPCWKGRGPASAFSGELPAGQSPLAQDGEAPKGRGLFQTFSTSRGTSLLQVLCIRMSLARACGQCGLDITPWTSTSECWGDGLGGSWGVRVSKKPSGPIRIHGWPGGKVWVLWDPPVLSYALQALGSPLNFAVGILQSDFISQAFFNYPFSPGPVDQRGVVSLLRDAPAPSPEELTSLVWCLQCSDMNCVCSLWGSAWQSSMSASAPD